MQEDRSEIFQNGLFLFEQEGDIFSQLIEVANPAMLPISRNRQPRDFPSQVHFLKTKMVRIWKVNRPER